MTGNILFIDDDPAMCELAMESLQNNGFTVATAGNAEDGMHALDQQPFDMVITDVNLPSASGLDLCQRISSTHPDLPVAVVTGFGSMETAIAAIRAGAYDFVTKPVDMELLRLTVERAVKHRQLSQEVERLRRKLQHQGSLGPLVGESRAMQKLYDLVERIGDANTTVLISGGSGTGKELVARQLHAQSQRSDKQFLAVNCAAMPASLLESELFGHERGAFTDAKNARDGLFVQADGGTLFLDEIGEMPLEMQPKLLRVLQESRVRPLGGNSDIPFDTRIIAATNRDLESDVEAGRFREDLFYRINVVEVHVPPLRSRERDVLLLAQKFIERAAQQAGKEVRGLSTSAAQKLLDYDWPGNVRELENCIERAVTLTRHQELEAEDLPKKVREYQSTQLVIGGHDPEDFLTIADLEDRYIRRVLKAVDGNMTQAAKILGVNRRTLYRKREKQDQTS